MCSGGGHWCAVLWRRDRKNWAVYDQRAVLCVRSDLCTDLVPFPADDENPVLHHLPDLQLGSSDDVLPDDFHGRFLWAFPGGNGGPGLAGLGTVRDDVSGAVLGELQSDAEMLGMHG